MLERIAAYALAARSADDGLMRIAALVYCAIDRDSGTIAEGVETATEIGDLSIAAGGTPANLHSSEQLNEIANQIRLFLAGPRFQAMRQKAGKANMHLVGVCVLLRVVHRKTVEESLEIVRLGRTQDLDSLRSMLRLARL